MDSTYNNEMSWASWMTPVDDEPTREAWLLSAIDRMARSLFPAFKRPTQLRAKDRRWRRRAPSACHMGKTAFLHRPIAG